jgi:hypothetical protein
MSDFRDWDESTYQIESMVRAAGDYVQVSRDLRPRVLETARTESGERRAQRSIRQMAIFFTLFAVFVAPQGQGMGSACGTCPAILAAVDSDHIFAAAEDKVARGGDLSWAMVEAFTDLRRQQADVLRLEL